MQLLKNLKGHEAFVLKSDVDKNIKGELDKIPLYYWMHNNGLGGNNIITCKGGKRGVKAKVSVNEEVIVVVR